MASTNISIRKEAYDFLRSLKESDQSFSDVILGFKKGRRNIMDFYGGLKDSNWKEKEEEMKAFRRDISQRLK